MRKINFFIFTCFIISFTSLEANAQKYVIDEKIEYNSSPDELATYKGNSIEYFISEIQKNIKIPQVCYDYEVNGTVRVYFIVTKKGKLKNIKVQKTNFNDLANRVQKWVHKSKGWIAAEEDGHKVNSNIEIEVPFNFSRKENLDKANYNGVNVKGFEIYLQKNCEIPDEAKVERSEGVVRVTFTINEEGIPTDFRIINSPSDILSKNTIDQIKKAGKWSPANKNGRNVKQDVTVVITYKLPLRLDQEPTYGNRNFGYILDHDDLISRIKALTLRSGYMEFTWSIDKKGNCELRNEFSSSLRAFGLLQQKFERLNWRPAKYGNKDVSVEYLVTIKNGFIRYDTRILMD